VGNSDGYISGPATYYLYSNPNQHGRLIYIPKDMDITLGSSAIYTVNDTIKRRYEDYAGYSTTLPLIHNILKVPNFKSKFEDIIENIIGQQINHSDFLFNRINALSIMIKNDVNWDRPIPRDYIVVPHLEVRKKHNFGYRKWAITGRSRLFRQDRTQEHIVSRSHQ
jgi:hypothetical protein